MQYYIINTNKDNNGKNEIHTLDCYYRPEEKNQKELGYFNDEIEAKNFAKQNGWPNADGCFHCCRKAHTG